MGTPPHASPWSKWEAEMGAPPRERAAEGVAGSFFLSFFNSFSPSAKLRIHKGTRRDEINQ